jgi:putative ABC transport system substrate-binding protein
MGDVGVFMNLKEGDPEAAARLDALREGLAQLGRRDVEIECLYDAHTDEARRKNADALVDSGVKVIQASTGLAIEALQNAMTAKARKIPIVFAGVIDPVATERVSSAAKPGSASGAASFEVSIGAKWVALLKIVVPGLKRMAVIHDPSTRAGKGQFAAINRAAKALAVEVTKLDVRNLDALDDALAEFAGSRSGGRSQAAKKGGSKRLDRGLVVTAGTLAARSRDVFIKLAAKHRLPAVYPNCMYADCQGMVAYGPVTVDLYRRAAVYVDRALRGEDPTDIPVLPTINQLAVNLRTARKLGFEIPPELLLLADTVIK